MRTRIMIFLLTAGPLLASGGMAAGIKPPAGDYYCYVYASKAIFVGALTLLEDGGYRVKGKDIGGRYHPADVPDALIWDGPPPLGFEAAGLETEGGHTKLRLYRKAADIGNSWKAAVCTLRQPGS